MAEGNATFTVKEVMRVKSLKNSGAELSKLYHKKASYDLPKIKLSRILVRNMMSPSAKRKIENRHIIKTLNKVEILAARNHLPTTHRLWEINQGSKYLGKKRKP